MRLYSLSAISKMEEDLGYGLGAWTYWRVKHYPWSQGEMTNRTEVIERGITDNWFGSGGGVKSSSFNKCSGPSDIMEMKGLLESIFNTIGSRKVAMFISSHCALNTLKYAC